MLDLPVQTASLVRMRAELTKEKSLESEDSRLLELLGRFELPTSSLPKGFVAKSGVFYRKFVFCAVRFGTTIVL